MPNGMAGGGCSCSQGACTAPPPTAIASERLLERGVLARARTSASPRASASRVPGTAARCTLHDRVYHWEEHDQEDHSGEPKQSHAVGLLDPDGTFWHYWCAPLAGRGLFGFVRDDETRLNLCTLVTPGTQTTQPAAAVHSQVGKEL